MPPSLIWRFLEEEKNYAIHCSEIFNLYEIFVDRPECIWHFLICTEINWATAVEMYGNGSGII